jgi:cytosine permease
MFWSLAIAGTKVGGFTGLQASAPKEPMPIGEAITIVVGTFISGGTQATNWSRFNTVRLIKNHRILLTK